MMRKRPIPQPPSHHDLSSMQLEERLEFLQTEIEALQQRNFDKDRGKEFESSYTRVFFLMFVTYWTLFGYMYIIDTNNPWLDAIVPTVGFNISTWGLPVVKEYWIQTPSGNVESYGWNNGIEPGIIRVNDIHVPKQCPIRHKH